ncbi:hypothetical protein BaRGS_00011203, partial [Batillaria attramentaria]
MLKTEEGEPTSLFFFAWFSNQRQDSHVMNGQMPPLRCRRSTRKANTEHREEITLQEMSELDPLVIPPGDIFAQSWL